MNHLDHLLDGSSYVERRVEINFTAQIRLEWRWGFYEVQKVGGSLLGVRSPNDGADHGHSIELFLWGLSLKDDALNVGCVDSADANGSGSVSGLTELVQDVTDSGSSDDILGVGLAEGEG